MQEKLLIKGGNRLHGSVEISGAKNAAVAIIPACLLVKAKCRLENLPDIKDVKLYMKILKRLNAKIEKIDNHTYDIDCTEVNSFCPDSDLTRSMRGSSYLMGALLGRFHRFNIDTPGGCDFGTRPIDLHIKCFKALGCKISEGGGLINGEAESLKGANVYFDIVTVGATVNAILAATLAEGTTIIENAAKEPHIVDLANFLNSMGADIRGAGTDVIKIHGVDIMHGTNYPIIPDQIEAGTYMTIAAATGGDVLIKNVIPKHLEAITDKLIQAGCEIEEYDDSIRVRRTGVLNKTNVKTLPHPGFPTDMQPQMTTLLSIAQGTSIVTEGVWDNRFKYVDELHRMGAKIQVDGKVAVVEGVEQLSGAQVKALDLRAGVALVQAALSAKGTSEIEDIHWVERGYEDLIGKLQKIGADIKKVTIPDGAFAKNA